MGPEGTSEVTDMIPACLPASNVACPQSLPLPMHHNSIKEYG